MICNISQDPANSQELELTGIAIKALTRTIPSTCENFCNKDQRDFIMEGIFRAMFINDEQIQIDALQALEEVPEIAYTSIAEYIPKIGEATMNYLQANMLAQTRQIMTFWTSLCVEERKHALNKNSLNIVFQFKDGLLPIIFQALSITEFEVDDDNVEDTPDEVQWTVSRAAGALLTEVALVLGDNCVSETIQFASSKLNGMTWQDQFVGMMALGSICEGPNSDLIQREIDPAY